MRILNFLRGKDERSWTAPKVVLLDIKNEKLIDKGYLSPRLSSLSSNYSKLYRWQSIYMD